MLGLRKMLHNGHFACAPSLTWTSWRRGDPPGRADGVIDVGDELSILCTAYPADECDPLGYVLWEVHVRGELYSHIAGGGFPSPAIAACLENSANLSPLLVPLVTDELVTIGRVFEAELLHHATAMSDG